MGRCDSERRVLTLTVLVDRLGSMHHLRPVRVRLSVRTPHGSARSSKEG